MSKPTHAKKKRSSRPTNAATSDGSRRSVRLALDCLEVTRGHDGFLRGKPEPTLLIAAYRACGAHPLALVGRLLVRARLDCDIPCSVALGEQELHYDASFGEGERIVVLVLAVEEDSGAGVRALYAALETPDRFLLYDAASSEPAPRDLAEWGKARCLAPTAQPVEVLLGETSLMNLASSDDYVSAAAFSVGTHTHCDEVWRLPFIAPDARNDWTLVARLRIGP